MSINNQIKQRLDFNERALSHMIVFLIKKYDKIENFRLSIYSNNLFIIQSSIT